jgi:penicillin-binding protein 2
MIGASRRRLVVLYVVVASLLITLGGRLWYIQVMNGTSYKTQAVANQTRNVVVPAVRGKILDDVGNALVTNRTALVVSVDMMTLSQRRDGGASVLARLAPMLGMSDKLLQEKTRLCTATVPQPCWAGSPYQPIPVAQDVSDQTALQIMEEQSQFPGVTADTEGVVSYPQPYGANPAQVLGYLQPATTQELKADHLPADIGYSSADLVGQAGLEQQYNNQITGTVGTKTVSVNAAGDVTGTVSTTPPRNGDNLVTSINAQLQADVQRDLAGQISRARAAGRQVNQGAAIVMTTTGQIVAMASYPDYNPGVWTNGISQSEFNALFGASGGEPAVNWAVQGQYAPGSTWKVTTAAAAVANGYGINGSYARHRSPSAAAAS